MASWPLASVAVLAIILNNASAASAARAIKPLLQARVDQVIDAATLRLDDGSTVRLSGALPPETPGW